MDYLAELKLSLGEPAPRVVDQRMRALIFHGEKQWRVVMVLATLACAIGFIIFFPWQLANTVTLDLSSSTTSGRIANSVFIKTAVGSHMFMRRKRIYLATFVFTDHLGRQQEARCLTTRKLASGDSVDVDYNRSDPEIARIEGGFMVAGGYWAGLWAMLFPGLVVFGGWNRHRWRLRRTRLLSHGALTRGVVEQLWTDGAPDKNNGWVAIHFTADGARVQVTESTNGAGLKRARAMAESQTELSVLYDLSSPRDCIVLDFLPGSLSQSYS